MGEHYLSRQNSNHFIVKSQILIYNSRMSSLDKILGFTDLLQRFRAIERILLMNGKDRNENDVEHSFSLAMLGWYINSTYELGLDSEKILKYALVHDFVEVYAGDTFFYQQDEKSVAEKKLREEKALMRLAAELPEFPEFHALILNYEKREDKESKFIYALDKLEPILNIYLDKGRSWKRDSVSFDMLKISKTPKVAADKTIEQIFSEMLQKLTDNQKSLFP